MAVKGIIFDYSGTLSIGAVLFASPGRLAEELRRSGLGDLGVTTPAVFWDQIVNPTWERGSTTAVGYKKVMAQRVAEVFGREPSAVSLPVSRFVDAYFEQSKIDVRWWPLLKTLAADPSAKTIIASDHYAEATDVIAGCLTQMGIRTVSVRDATGRNPDVSFFIANSADIGFPKTTERYWHTVRGLIRQESLMGLFIVDDFGANEQPGDSYARNEKVTIRRQQTVDILEKVFAVEVESFPFILTARDPDGGVDDQSYRTLISEASARVTRYLNREP